MRWKGKSRTQHFMSDSLCQQTETGGTAAPARGVVQR
ncbi:unnamed protein product [Ascophyllum nodosum]